MNYEIIYYADNASMGDNSENSCNKYRAWAESEIKREYPEHRVTVSNQPSLNTIETNDIENSNDILDFVSRLWDRQPDL